MSLRFASLSPLAAVALALSARSQPSVSGEIVLQMLAPTNPNPTYTFVQDVGVWATDDHGTAYFGNNPDVTGGPFEIDLASAGTYSVEADASFTVEPGLFGTVDLGSATTSEIEVDGPVDLGTITLQWQPR